MVNDAVPDGVKNAAKASPVWQPASTSVQTGLRRKQAGLRSPIIQTISCNSHSGTVAFVLQSGIGVK